MCLTLLNSLASKHRCSPLVPRGERMESLMQPCRRVRPGRSRSPKELGQRGLTRSRGIFLTTPIALCYESYSDAKCESGQPKRMNSERAMESIGNGRLRVGEHVQPSPLALRAATIPQERGKQKTPREVIGTALNAAPRAATPESRNSQTRNASRIEKCSLMFAYVRLLGKKC